jgi:hypothetical protein
VSFNGEIFNVMCVVFHLFTNKATVSLFSFGDPVRVLVEYKVHVNEIFHEITKLDANKSSGTDNIRPRYLK